MLSWVKSLVKPFEHRYPRAASIYRGVRDQLDGMQKPMATQWGFSLVGNDAMAKGEFEPRETELVRLLLLDSDILVNVGANVGYYCCHALSLGRPVIAFEPMWSNLHHLCANIKNNNWSNVEVFPLALSDHVGILNIYGGSTGASLVKGWAGIPNSYRTLVPCSTMDLVLGQRLAGKRALVLVDIEGAEKWMLEGAHMMLANDPAPTWILEVTSRELQPNGIDFNPNFAPTFEIFFRNGYQAFDLEQEMLPITPDYIEKIVKGEVVFKSNNFLFRKS